MLGTSAAAQPVSSWTGRSRSNAPGPWTSGSPRRPGSWATIGRRRSGLGRGV